MWKSIIFWLVAIALVSGWATFIFWPNHIKEEQINDEENMVPTIDHEPFQTKQAKEDVSSESTEQTNLLYEPTANFEQRVTIKPFGIYVSPDDSPIKDERFEGYHTGADAEYEDAVDEVEVRAITDGTVESARRANGYGGIVVAKHQLNQQEVLVVYGHLDPGQLIKEGSKIEAGQKIGVLGKGQSKETDGERKHLHLGILRQTSNLDVRGYVQQASELEKWIDPASLELATYSDIK